MELLQLLEALVNMSFFFHISKDWVHFSFMLVIHITTVFIQKEQIPRKFGSWTFHAYLIYLLELEIYLV